MLENQQILSLIKQTLNKELGVVVDDIILFGSRINKKNRIDSDYDILIILNIDYNWKLKDKITEILYDIELDYNILLDIHLISTNELQNSLRGSEPIYQNAIKQGVHA